MNALPHSTIASPRKAEEGIAMWWYRAWHWLCVNLYFDRVRVLYPERLAKKGAVLYIALHRNGAVDGFLYHGLVQEGVFLVSSQLRRSFFARLFFGGISVSRKQDEGSRDGNAEAMDECGRLLERGGKLIVFPEGTSSLGPRHLPFKSGAAKIAVDALSAGMPLRIVPLGIHYECAWGFRSRVEIVVGEAVPVTEMETLAGLGKLKEMKRRMEKGLCGVGVNFRSAEEQERCERNAYAATLGTDRSYYLSLKTLEAGEVRLMADEEFKMVPSLLRHQGVPLFPQAPWIAYLFLLLLLAPPVAGGWMLNLPPLLLGWLAARRMADGKNVIALWRIMVGVPLGVLWFCGMTACCAWRGGVWAVLGYVCLTWCGLRFYPRVKKLAVAVWNGAIRRRLGERAMNLHGELLRNLPNE